MEIDFRKIGQKKIREYLIKFGINNLDGFSRMKPLCYSEALATTYRKHFQTFLIKKDIGKVWNIYSTLHPKEAWNGNMVTFGLQYSRRTNSINYLNDPYSGIEKGQILLLNLKLLWGLLNIAVGHEVVEIDEKQRVIKLSYMHGGASEGSQWISLTETKEGFTKISHLTRYKSKSAFRDRILYPPLHTKAISEFHGKVRNKAMSGDS